MNETNAVYKIQKVLKGAVSFETAHVQEDYPYSFNLRCQRRCWLEHKPGKGYRFVTCTSNPKKPGTWNKPKASTYTNLAVLVLTDEHTDARGEASSVSWVGLYFFDADRVAAFEAAFGADLDDNQAETVKAMRLALARGKKETSAVRVHVEDATTGEVIALAAAKSDPMFVQAFAADKSVSGLDYNPPLEYLDATHTRAVYHLPMLGRVARCTVLSEPAATAAAE